MQGKDMKQLLVILLLAATGLESEAWRAFVGILSEFYPWNDSLLNTTSEAFQNLSAQARQLSPDGTFFVISFERSLVVRFYVNSSDDAIPRRLTGQNHNQSIFVGPLVKESPGIFLQTLRFPFNNNTNNPLLKTFLQEYIDRLGIRLTVQNVSYGSARVNFAVNLSQREANSINSSICGTPLLRFCFERYFVDVQDGMKYTENDVGQNILLCDKIDSHVVTASSSYGLHAPTESTHVNQTVNSIQNIRNSSITAQEMIQQANSFLKTETITEEEVRVVEELLISHADAAESSGQPVDEMTLLHVADIVDTVMISRDHMSITDNLVQLLDRYARVTDLQDRKNLSIEAEVFSMQVLDVVGNEDLNFVAPYRSSKIAKIHIPRESFPKLLDNRISIMVFRDTASFPDPKNLEMVVAIKVGREKTQNLEKRIVIEFTGTEVTAGKRRLASGRKVNRTQIECRYYDTQAKQWATDGCYLNEGKAIPTCEVDHLTNFAIVVKSDVTLDDVALSIVSKIGCALSILGLSITIIVFVHSKKWKRNRPALEMLHVCFNLIIAYIIFLVGIERTEERIQCIAATATLQYFYLTTWLWIGIYARDMYISLVMVYAKQPSNFLAKAMGIAYGIPMVIVAVHASVTTLYFDNLESNVIATTDGVRYRKSTYFAQHVCWLHEYSLYFGFLLPVGVIFSHNLSSFLLVIYEIIWKADKITSSAKKKTTVAKLQLVGIVGALIGMTWTFGFLLLVSEDEVFVQVTSWLFAIFNSTQGFSIFVLLCVRSKEIRKTWLKLLRDKLSKSRMYQNSHRSSVLQSSSSDVTQSSSWQQRGSRG